MTFVNANDVKNYIWHSYNSINELQRNDMTFVNANYVKDHSHILGLNTSANSFVNPNKQKITFGWETITIKIP